MLKEDLSKRWERFLQATILFSDQTIKASKEESVKRCKDKRQSDAFNDFINWSRQENEAAVFTTFAYADLALPKQFDCIFSYDNPADYIRSNFAVTQSIFEGWYPADTIVHGSKHLCVLRFEETLPGMLNRLYYETGIYSSRPWDSKEVLGFCQMDDLQHIIDRRQKEARMRQLYGLDWYDFDE